MVDDPDCSEQSALPRSATRRSRGQIAATTLLIAASAVSLLVAVLWVLLDADTWIVSDTNVDGFTKMLGVVLGSQALAVAGLMWLIPTLFAIRVRRLRTRWIAVPPAIVILGAIAIAVIPAHDFYSSQEQLEQLADTTGSHSPGWVEHYGITHPVRAGKLDIRHLTHRDDGVVLVGDADMAVTSGDSGWARSTEGPPTFQPGTPGLEVEHLDGHWYRYRYSD
ncbi:hypothetical protein [Rhodococcus sp. IEGM 1408]|uniref:hypothetical protein n=1 Tax=Rhodococcus sp. IEGM 1408 TaxID=3082220 RepID=UPI0029532E95|nr:hypothetical protein [Rhodococcus sp. IEGM 1408]MDV8000779.1 hypothetical protein [Rhodococcus sp. IEGM 1408]